MSKYPLLHKFRILREFEPNTYEERAEVWLQLGPWEPKTPTWEIEKDENGEARPRPQIRNAEVEVAKTLVSSQFTGRVFKVVGRVPETVDPQGVTVGDCGERQAPNVAVSFEDPATFETVLFEQIKGEPLNRKRRIQDVLCDNIPGMLRRDLGSTENKLIGFSSKMLPVTEAKPTE